MAIAWLSRLPIPLISGASNQELKNIQHNEVETGPARFELLSEHGPAKFNVSWLFTDLENQLFEGWYKHELSFGAKAFDMDLKVGAGLKSHECYFLGHHKSSMSGKLNKVKATLLIIEKQYDTLVDYNALKAANP